MLGSSPILEEILVKVIHHPTVPVIISHCHDQVAFVGDPPRIERRESSRHVHLSWITLVTYGSVIAIVFRTDPKVPNTLLALEKIFNGRGTSFIVHGQIVIVIEV